MIETVIQLGQILNSLGTQGDQFQIGSYILAGSNTALNYPVSCNNDFTVPTRWRRMEKCWRIRIGLTLMLVR